MEKKKDSLLVCENCGSSRVQTKMWVNPNTHKVFDSCSDGDDEDNWCQNCCENGGLITQAQYNKQKTPKKKAAKKK